LVIAVQDLRIGIIGTESSHVDHIIDYLNVKQARPGCRVVALAGGDDARNSDLARLGRISQVVGTSEDLLSLADALLVTTRHGALHQAQATPFLAEGRPVLVDKPLACSMADAQQMIATAETHGALLTSYSTLRHLPETVRLAADIASLGPLRSVVATGPADEDSPYGGIFFYGIHPVDIALLLAPGQLGPVRAYRAAESIVAEADLGDVHVTINLIRPGADGPVPFHALAIGRSGVASGDLPISGNYVAHGLAAFLDMVCTGAPTLSAEDMLRPVAFLEKLQQALDKAR
jgi:predicted dehydrogenase